MARQPAPPEPRRPSVPTPGGPMADARFPCPPLVAANPRARAYWDGYVAEGARGALQPSDMPILARLCIALALADEATDGVARTGMLVRYEGAPAPVPNPLIAVMNAQAEIASRLAQRLELSLKSW